jgi:hypothetical protein
MPEDGTPPTKQDETHPEESTLAEVVAKDSPPAPLLSKSHDNKEAGITLAQLLSFEGLKTSEEIATRFHIIAQELFANYKIRIQPGDKQLNSNPPAAALGGTKEQPPCVELQLMEMEFYLISPDVHEDPYCHGSIEQTHSGCWSVACPLDDIP